jgi:uracil-DNA glycosylase family 4
MKVKTVGPANAKIFLVGEAPGKDEDRIGQPFVGYAGKTLNWLLGQAGISRAEVKIANVARVRPPNNKIATYFEDRQCTIPTLQMAQWIIELKQELEECQPNIVVALGATALWALTGEKSIGKLRGYTLPCQLVPGMKVLATYHPQAINYEWKNFFPCILDLKKAKYHSEFRELKQKFPQIVDNASVSDFVRYLQQIYTSHDEPISVDIETIQPGSHISTIGIATSPMFGMSTCILKGKYPCLNENEEIELNYWLSKVLTSKQLIFQNAPYDTSVLLLNNRIWCKNVAMDTLIAAHVCWPELPRDLGFLASIALDVPPWKHLSSVNNSLYNGLDCCYTYGIAEFMEKEVDRLHVRENFKHEMSQIPVASMLQLQGLQVDEVIQKQLIKECESQVKETKTLLTQIIGRDVNYASPKQLQKLLYIDLGLPVQYKKRKSRDDERKITTDASALKKLMSQVPSNPIFKLILEHKKALKLGSFLNMELSPEGRVHTSYNIAGSAEDSLGRKSFGRWSSSGSIILPFGSGNLQNIPPDARKIYRAKPGYKIVQADYVQAEAVVVGYLSGDQRLINLFEASFGLRGAVRKEKYDIHVITARDMFGVQEVTKEQRQVGKTIRHGANYSAGPQVLSILLNTTSSRAKQLIDLYYQANPQLRLWHQSIQDELRRDRTLVTPLGRRHRFLERWGDELFRSAYAYKPQSTVGDLLNMSLVKLYNLWGDNIEIMLQLHDAVYVQVPEEEVQTAIAVMRQGMIRPVEVNHRTMVIDVDFKVGDSWGEQVEVDWQDYTQALPDRNTAIIEKGVICNPLS